MLKTVFEILGNKKVLRFLLSALFLLIIWVLFTVQFPTALYKLHYWTIEPQAHFSSWILGLFGYTTKVWHNVNNCMTLLDMNNSAVVCVGTGCSGLELFLVFIVFVMLFKGSSKNFLWFIPAGLLLILALNVIRIVLLSLIAYHAPDYLAFNHKYTFVIIVYGFVIFLWLYWINHYYETKQENS